MLEDEIHREEEGNKNENTGTQDRPSEEGSLINKEAVVRKPH